MVTPVYPTGQPVAGTGGRFIFFFFPRAFLTADCPVARTVLLVSLQAWGTMVAIYIPAAPGCAEERAKSKPVSLGGGWESAVVGGGGDFSIVKLLPIYISAPQRGAGKQLGSGNGFAASARSWLKGRSLRSTMVNWTQSWSRRLAAKACKAASLNMAVHRLIRAAATKCWRRCACRVLACARSLTKLAASSLRSHHLHRSSLFLRFSSWPRGRGGPEFSRQPLSRRSLDQWVGTHVPPRLAIPQVPSLSDLQRGHNLYREPATGSTRTTGYTPATPLERGLGKNC